MKKNLIILVLLAIAGVSHAQQKVASKKVAGSLVTQTEPMYKGGVPGLQAYLQSKIRNIEDLLFEKDPRTQLVKDSVSKTIFVQFTIDKDGNLMDPRVFGREDGDQLRLQIEYILQNMPQWDPGTIAGIPFGKDIFLPMIFAAPTPPLYRVF